MSENNLIGMSRVDGSAVSEIHGDGFIAKPDENGVVLVPSHVVLTMLNAGYAWAIPRNPAQPRN